jgi:hypothetical protein
MQMRYCLKHKDGTQCLVDKDIWERHKHLTWGYGPKSAKGRYPVIYPIKGNGPVLLHRFVMKAKKGQYVDHIQNNVLDARRRSLRFCTNQQNTCRRSHTNEYRGVSKKRSFWEAKIRFNWKTYHLGCFTSKIAAARRYDAETRRLNGEFAVLNFPELS